MKLLHTSDWHLGQNFFSQNREIEHKEFLNWLIDLIKKEKIDILIVAGDIFDTATPPNYALTLYYNFLRNISNICKSVIIIAGNHDSVSTLKAPKEVLKELNINVVVDSDDSIIEIKKDDKLEAIICAVPFLRDSFIRKSVENLTSTKKEELLNEAIKNYYQTIYEKASKISTSVPLIATGHLTTTNSQLSDSERDIYIGNLLNLSGDFLANMFDYTALGHLHINQKISDKVFYSGSPIPLSFSEANSKKFVNIIEFENKVPNIEKVEIPKFRELKVLRGDLEFIKKEIKKISNKEVWIEIHLEDKNPQFAVKEIYDYSKELVTILAIKSLKESNHSLNQELKISLNEMKPLEVFKKRIEFNEIDDKKLEDELIISFKKILEEVQNEDY